MNPFNNVTYNPRDFDPDFINEIGPSAAIAVGPGRAKGGRPMIRINLLGAGPADQEAKKRRRRRPPSTPGAMQAYLLLGALRRRRRSLVCLRPATAT